MHSSFEFASPAVKASINDIGENNQRQIFSWGNFNLTAKLIPLKKPDSPPLKLHTMIYYRRRGYLFGGNNGKKQTNSLYIFDFDKMQWFKPHKSVDPPQKVSGHTASLYNKLMIVIGGWTGSECTSSNKISTLDLDSIKWKSVETKGDDPGPCYLHSASVKDQLLYLFKGSDSKKFFNDLYLLDLATYTWSKIETNGVAPTPRANHGAVIIDSGLLIYGGQNGQCTLSDFHLFCVENKTWRSIVTDSTAIKSRAGMSLMKINNNDVILFGGYNEKGEFYKDIAYLEINNDEINYNPIVLEESQILGRAQSSNLIVDDKYYIFSGVSGKKVLNDYQCLDFCKILILTRKTRLLTDADQKDLDIDISVLNNIENIMDIPKDAPLKCLEQIDEKPLLAFQEAKFTSESNKENIKENYAVSTDNSCLNISDSILRKTPEMNIGSTGIVTAIKRPNEIQGNTIKSEDITKLAAQTKSDSDGDSSFICQKRNKSKPLIRRYIGEIESKLDCFKFSSNKNDVLPSIGIHKVYEAYYKLREVKISRCGDESVKAVGSNSAFKIGKSASDVRMSHNNLYMNPMNAKRQESEVSLLSVRKNKSILEWLEEISLENYSSNFISRCCLDQTSLLKLNVNDDLLRSRFEISKLGHRLKIMYKIDDDQGKINRNIGILSHKIFDPYTKNMMTDGMDMKTALSEWLISIKAGDTFVNFLEAGFDDLKFLILLMDTKYCLNDRVLKTALKIEDPDKRNRILMKLTSDLEKAKTLRNSGATTDAEVLNLLFYGKNEAACRIF